MAGSASAGPASTDARIERFATLVESSHHNLLSARGRSELRSRHIPESRAFAALLPRGAFRLLDLGTGGGLPGMVIAIVRPEIDVHLLDATRKKVEFLRESAERVGVRVTLHHGRAEELARGPLRGAFDVVTARAVAPLATLVGWAAPFLGSTGQLFAIKGERWREELDDAMDAIRNAGLLVVATPDDQRAAESATEPRVIVLGRMT